MKKKVDWREVDILIKCEAEGVGDGRLQAKCNVMVGNTGFLLPSLGVINPLNLSFGSWISEQPIGFKSRRSCKP